MWRWLNSNAAAVQAISALVVCLLTIVLAAATLRYVFLTKKIATASRAQAEALHKPVLTFLRDDDATPTVHELMEHTVEGTDLFIGAVSPMKIVNIGSGPALGLKWTVKTAPSFKGMSEQITQGFMPYLASGDSFPCYSVTHIKMGGINFSLELVCVCQSLSGATYTSTTVVQNKKVLSFQHA